MPAAILLRPVADRLFRNDDTRARQRDWSVSVWGDGLGRAYRDPRFDLLRACSACLGKGIVRQDQACGICSGTGRVTLPGTERVAVAGNPGPEAERGWTMPSPRLRGTRQGRASSELGVGTVAWADLAIAARRWRCELLATSALTIVWIALGAAVAIAVTVAAGLAVAIYAAASLPVGRRILGARAWRVVTPLRVRARCAQARIHSRNVRISCHSCCVHPVTVDADRRVIVDAIRTTALDDQIIFLDPAQRCDDPTHPGEGGRSPHSKDTKHQQLAQPPDRVKVANQIKSLVTDLCKQALKWYFWWAAPGLDQ
jgi:hypothetical protein